ncbi:hypothetical protein VUR80DRAFT_5913 [Thermomyces stellatus]
MSSTKVKQASTPKRPAPPPVTESPGNWTHPRLKEITRRRNATTFTDKNVRRIVQNTAAIAVLYSLRYAVSSFISTDHLNHQLRTVATYTFLALIALPTLNIVLALLPLFRPEDTLSDIPLTPSQRRLLNLPPSSAPPTPNAVYSTPPRYSRTPSISGSIAGSASSRASVATNASPYSPTASPLQGKKFSPALNGRRSSFGSPGQLSGAKLFDTPSPSGKRTSVGLNSKWLYEKARRSSGSWMQ